MNILGREERNRLLLRIILSFVFLNPHTDKSPILLEFSKSSKNNSNGKQGGLIINK